MADHKPAPEEDGRALFFDFSSGPDARPVMRASRSGKWKNGFNLDAMSSNLDTNSDLLSRRETT